MESGSRVSHEQDKKSADVTGDESVEASSKTRNHQVIRGALTSQSFVEKVSLLLMTALLSGLIVPLVISSLQRTQTRNEAILQAQAKLLDDVSETILTYETLALDVTWFKTKEARSDAMHEKAFMKYNDRAVDLVAKWRAQAARAQTLVSPAVSAKIGSFLLSVFGEQDTPINELHRTKAQDEVWAEQHQKNIKMLEKANSLIAEIANDLKLSKQNLYR